MGSIPHYQYGDVLKHRVADRDHREIRVQFIRSATLKEHPGNMERMFIGITVRGGKTMASYGKIGRVNFFPYGGWVRDE